MRDKGNKKLAITTTKVEKSFTGEKLTAYGLTAVWDYIQQIDTE